MYQCLITSCLYQIRAVWIFRLYLRNEFNIFLADRGIIPKGTETCINARSATLQIYFVLFFGLIMKKILDLFPFIQFEFHYSYRKQTFILTLFNAGLFQTLNDAVIIMKFSGWCNNHLLFSKKRYVLNLKNNLKMIWSIFMKIEVLVVVSIEYLLFTKTYLCCKLILWIPKFMYIFRF